MLAKFIGIVKQQLQYWQYQVDHFGPDHPSYRPAKIAKYQYLIRDFSELLQYLERQEAQEAGDELPAAPSAERGFRGPFSIRRRVAEVLASAEPEAAIPEELADLPPELLDELSDSVKGEPDPLIKIINGRGGTATLDEILIDLWRKYKEVGKRAMVSNKLYRLSRRGLCWPLPGKKGIYTTTKPTTGGDTPTTENDDSESGAPESSSGKPESSTSAAQTASPSLPAARSSIIKRRSLFASTAIPPTRVPS
jgi:hypothetical protein